MAKPRPKREPKGSEQIPLPTVRQDATTRVLPMKLHVGDRLTDETGEYEVIGRPFTTNAGKDVHVRVQRIDNVEVTMIQDVGCARARQRATDRNS